MDGRQRKRKESERMDGIKHPLSGRRDNTPPEREKERGNEWKAEKKEGK